MGIAWLELLLESGPPGPKSVSHGRTVKQTKQTKQTMVKEKPLKCHYTATKVQFHVNPLSW